MLKRALIVTVLSILLTTVKSSAQSAVYFCSTTGLYGFCYAEDSEMAARECAYNNCIKMGGSQPVLVDYSSSKGFGAICIGEDYLGNKIIGVAFGSDTQDEADEEAKQRCEDQGGYKLRIKERWEDK